VAAPGEVQLLCAWRSQSIHFAGLRLRTWEPDMEGSTVRPILLVLGSWVVMSAPVSLLVGSVLKRLDSAARRQAPTAKVLEPHSAKLYSESSSRPAA
jgi:hypothetical protein